MKAPKVLDKARSRLIRVAQPFVAQAALFLNLRPSPSVSWTRQHPSIRLRLQPSPKSGNVAYVLFGVSICGILDGRC